MAEIENHLVELEKNAEVVQFLRSSGNLLKQLPVWKRGVLEASSRSGSSEPRQPVVDPTEGHKNSD